MVIGRGRRREHPMDTSEGVKWPSVTTGVVELPVAHAHTQGNPEGVKWPLVTSGSHVTTTKKKAREKAGYAQNIISDRASSGQVTDVTSGQKTTLGQILRNFRLSMHRTYFWQGTWLTSLPVTSLSVTWLPVAPLHRSTANMAWAVPIYYWRHSCPFCMLFIPFFLGTKISIPIPYPYFECKTVGRVDIGKFTVNKAY